ncbi:MAG: hypothetical protein IIX75_01170, partial [Clostridia bacterium]|nr:hypothetical protein [Clostridia bacterium]
AEDGAEGGKRNCHGKDGEDIVIKVPAGTATGGMTTKLRAASTCMASGVDMIIANGGNPELLYDIADGKPIGTRFSAK